MTPLLGLFTFFAVFGFCALIFLHTKVGKRWLQNLDK